MDDMRSWEAAQVQCSSEGGTLVEARDEVDHDAIDFIFGKH